MLDFFFLSKYQAPALNDDIHAHLLPGVDDGAGSMEETLDILLAMREKGVESVVFTPHIMADYPMNDAEYLKRRFKLFTDEYKALPEGKYPKVRLAAEYMLDEDFDGHLEQGLLTYDGRHALVEMSCVQRPMDLEEKLYRMQLCGYIPVLAHPERYLFLSVREFGELKEKGCLFQLNLFSLQGLYGLPAKQNAEKLLKMDWYDFLGSDIHSSDHISFYSTKFLSKKFVEQMKRLGENNKMDQ